MCSTTHTLVYHIICDPSQYILCDFHIICPKITYYAPLLHNMLGISHNTRTVLPRRGAGASLLRRRRRRRRRRQRRRLKRKEKVLEIWGPLKVKFTKMSPQGVRHVPSRGAGGPPPPPSQAGGVKVTGTDHRPGRRGPEDNRKLGAAV